VALTYSKTFTTTAAPNNGGDVTSGTIAVTTGDVVLALWANSDFDTGDTVTFSSTGGLLGTWTTRATVANGSSCHVSAAFAVATGSGNITVSCASSNPDPIPGSMAVIVHTGAHATDPVPTGKVYSGSGATDVSQSITPTASGSCLWMIAADWNQTNSYAARTNCTIDAGNTHNVSGEYTNTIIRPTTQPRTDGAAFTIGETDTSGSIAWIALEVQAAAGAAATSFVIPTTTMRQSILAR
jgi:hypothetical protein